MTYITMISESKRALSHEIQYHKELAPVLNEFAPSDFISRLAALAAVVNIVVDGVFTDKEIDSLCDKITQRLRDRRVLIVSTRNLMKSPGNPGDTLQ